MRLATNGQGGSVHFFSCHAALVAASPSTSGRPRNKCGVTVPLDKKSLRAQCLALRERIAPDDAKAASLQIAGHLLNLVPASATIVAGYRSVRGEMDMFEALAQLSERGHELCLPVVAKSPSHKGRGNFLTFRRWRIGHTLELGAYGIEIPPASEPELMPDAVLVPLVAFDASLHRLGYGAGFYDATIHQLRGSQKTVQIIGVAFAAQQVEHIPAEGHDEKLDAVVTEKGVVIVGRGT